MAGHGVVELLSSVIHEVDSRIYSLSIIEKLNESGKRVREFGIVKRYYELSSKRWRKAPRRHIFLPLDVWSKLTVFSDAVARLAKFDEDLPMVIKRSVPAPPTNISNLEDVAEHTVEKHQHPSLDEKRDVVLAPKVKRYYRHRNQLGSTAKELSKPAEPSAHRKRGRPRKQQDGCVPKRAKKTMKGEHDAETQTTLDAPAVATTTSEQ
jgi:hypothetical protein